MRLVRLATIYFTGPPIGAACTEMHLSDCEVTVIMQKPSDKGVLQCVAASKNLSVLPRVDGDNLVIIPGEDRELLEECISHFSHINSLNTACASDISSTHPCVALVPETDQDRAFLNKVGGIFYPTGNRGFPEATYKIDLRDPSVVGDRLDGAALLAQALKSQGASALFMMYVRLFERAFAKPFGEVPKPLSIFLKSADLGYTRGEINRWVGFRHNVSHADIGSKPIMLDVDVSWVVGRAAQAAYDVLMNKAHWGESSVTRRTTWRPVNGTMDADAGLLATRGHNFEMKLKVFDEFRRFPLNLKGVFTSLPNDWWSGPLT